MRSPLLAATLAAVLVTASSARADDPVPHKAKRLATAGRSLHEQGEYGKAIIAFQEAYVLAPSPALLFNLAQAYRLDGNCEDAAYMYRRFLAQAPRNEARAISQAQLPAMERCIYKRGLGIPEKDTAVTLGMPPEPSITTVPMDTVPTPPSSRARRNAGIGMTVAGGVVLLLAASYALSDNDGDAAYLAVGGGVIASGGIALWTF